MNTNLILFVHLLSAGMMTSLIWVIQLVHYPSFHYIANLSSLQSNNFHQFHSSRISYIVIPLMLTELTTGILLAFKANSEFLSWQSLNLFIIILIWATTFFIQVPHHNDLARSFTRPEVEALVKYNWIRTALWTFHLLIVSIAFTKLLSTQSSL